MIETYEVKEYLNSRLGCHVQDRAQFDKWLDALFDDDRGSVLGFNIYIDLKSNALEQELVIQVIDRMAASHSNARDSFCLSVEDERYQPQYVCKHSHGSQPLDEDRYVRIMPLDDMIEYYFRYAMTLPSSSNYASQNKVLRQFFNPNIDRRKGLGLIAKTWRGRMYNVWVTSKREMDELRSITSKNSFADEVGERLGFDQLIAGDKLLGIIYPVNLDHLETYIPTTLDAHNGCNFFVPFASGDVDWGLSCCLNLNSRQKNDPDIYGFKERVHESFEGLTDEFEGEIIGDVTESAAPDLNHLFHVARRRADSV
jgi:hypothetical protein